MHRGNIVKVPGDFRIRQDWLSSEFSDTNPTTTNIYYAQRIVM